MTTIPFNTTFVLENPFDFQGTNYTKFDLRRPKVLDIRRFFEDANKLSDIEAIEKLISQLAGVPPAVVAQIDYEDFVPIRKFVLDFLKSTSVE